MLQYTYKKYKCWEAAAALESSLSFEHFFSWILSSTV
jgi:hypothetical protein